MPMRSALSSTRGQKRPLEESAVNASAPNTTGKKATPHSPRAGTGVNRIGLATQKTQQEQEVLQQKIQDLNSTIEAEKESNQKLRGEMVTCMRKMEETSKRAQCAETSVREKQNELERLREENQVVLVDLQKTMENTIQATQKTLEEAREELVIKKQEFEQLRSEHEEALQSAKCAYDQLSDRFRCTVTEHEEAMEQLRQSHEKECTEKQKQVHDREEAIVQLENSVASMRCEINTLQALLATKESLVQSLQGNLNGISSNMTCLQGVLSNKEREMSELLAKGERERRKLLNVIEELRGNIRVYCRVRPVLPGQSGPVVAIEYPDLLDHRDITIRTTRDNATSTGRSEKPQTFRYDHVFGPSATQEDVFEQVAPLVESVLDGYKVCIFAYGQTGSGKTHTMEGAVDGSNMGIIPRSITQLFQSAQALANKHKWKFTIACTYIEIYNDVIRDLLTDSDDYHRAVCESGEMKHEIRHEGKTDTTITGIRTVTVTEPYQVQDLLSTAARNRTTARTKLNERSSRSHSVFTMKFEGINEMLGQKSLGVLCLVDLAGSERVVDSGAIGNASRMKEAVSINQSLSHLGVVIAALGQNATNTNGSDAQHHVPFRNCKLTYLLQNYLGGEGGRMLMFVNVSPLEEHTAETANSLRFAAKVNSTVIGTAKRRVVNV